MAVSIDTALCENSISRNIDVPLGTTLKESNATCAMKPNEFKAILDGLLNNLNVEPLEPQKPFVKLWDDVFAKISPLSKDQALAKAVSNAGALVGVYFYPMHEYEVQYLIAVYSAFYLVLDDAGEDVAQDISLYRQRLMNYEPQSELFNCMTWLFAEFDKHFPPVCANKIFSGIIGALSILEVELDRSVDFPKVSSPSFAKYFRNMTGTAEAYVYFLLTKEDYSMLRLKRLIQAAGELHNITDEINDLFSFYKEAIVGTETNTYVYQQADIDNIPVEEIVKRLPDVIFRRYQTILDTVKDDERLYRLANEFVIGQVLFYVKTERYRLSELEWSS